LVSTFSSLWLVARASYLSPPRSLPLLCLPPFPTRRSSDLVLLSTLVVASRSGGSLVTALRNIATTLETRKETRREVGTILSETTSTVWALGAMSVGAVLRINAIEPGILRVMTTTVPGRVGQRVGAALFTVRVLRGRRDSR